jgi:hypothetical protein
VIDYLDHCIKEGSIRFCRENEIYAVSAREALERRVCAQIVASALSWIMADPDFVDKLKGMTDE